MLMEGLNQLEIAVLIVSVLVAAIAVPVEAIITVKNRKIKSSLKKNLRRLILTAVINLAVFAVVFSPATRFFRYKISDAFRQTAAEVTQDSINADLFSRVNGEKAGEPDVFVYLKETDG